MTLRGLVVGLAVFLTVLGTGFLVAARDPEEAFIQSADGVVTVSGKARASHPFAVSTEAPLAHTVLRSAQYVIAPQDAYLETPAVLTFTVSHLDIPAAEAVVYRYRTDMLMWEPLSEEIVRTDEIVAVETRELGVFALGRRENVDAPDFISVYDALRGDAPEQALGYTTTVGYARDGEEPIRLLNIGEQGGCNGAVLPGEDEAQSRMERTASVYVNDVQTTVNFSFVARWFVAEGESCPEGMPFRPSSAYGILPTS